MTNFPISCIRLNSYDKRMQSGTTKAGAAYTKRYLHNGVYMYRSLFVRLVRRPVIAATSTILLGVCAFALSGWFTTPSPLTTEEEKAVTAAVHKIRPGFNVANLRRDRQGIVRAFVSSGHLGGETIAVEKTSGQWVARVETVYF